MHVLHLHADTSVGAVLYNMLGMEQYHWHQPVDGQDAAILLGLSMAYEVGVRVLHVKSDVPFESIGSSPLYKLIRTWINRFDLVEYSVIPLALNTRAIEVSRMSDVPT